MDDVRKEALRRWYAQSWVLDAVKKSYQDQDWEDVEALVHRNVLFPLGKHDQLPDYMLDDNGKTLFPTNLNPQQDLEIWQDAIEVGWEVMADELGITMEDVQKRINKEQDADWELFMKSVEERKKKSKGED